MMISQSNNRVQSLKSKFENLTNESTSIVVTKRQSSEKHLFKHRVETGNECKENVDNIQPPTTHSERESDSSSDDWSPKPNASYLHGKNDVKRSASDSKKCLVRQSSDPGKKLHRSHAFRCDRSLKISPGPKRVGSCHGRSESSDFSLKMSDKKLSKDRLKKLGNLLEDQMRKECFVPSSSAVIVGEVCNMSPESIPDSEVPSYILDQYAKVVKPKKNEDNKQDAMTDSGVSSETENLEEDRTGRIKKLMSQFEKADTLDVAKLKSNLASMDNLAGSSETIKLERKNPDLTLTNTLKKALKQPLPPGPPPKKPPRTFTMSPIPEKEKKDTRKMLEKLELVLQKKEALKLSQCNVPSQPVATKPKEIHYLSTAIADITQRSLPMSNPSDPLTNCFHSLNCAVIPSKSTSSLPYYRLSHGSDRNSQGCSCNDNNETKRLSTFQIDHRCSKCQANDSRDGFKCHLKCKCRSENSEFFVEKEHIYDEPYIGDHSEVLSDTSENGKRSGYGTLNNLKQSRSAEDVRDENQRIYDIPFESTPPASPTYTSSPKTNFDKIRQNFESKISETDLVRDRLHKSADGPHKSAENSTKTHKETTELAKHKLIKTKSMENIVEERFEKRVTEKKRFNRFKSDSKLIKKNNLQLDADRQNLNLLMNEIYETVTAVCNMDDNRPGSFPTEHSDSTSEESVKVTKSLTEKRKNYVRRVSSRVGYLDTHNVKSTRTRHQTSICSFKSDRQDNPYSTFRSWKSFRQSPLNQTMDKSDTIDSKLINDSTVSTKDEDIDKSMDEKTGCVDISLPFAPRERGLFNVCLLVGLNYMTGQAYVKSVFPSQVEVPPHIENLIFPETLSSTRKGEWSAEAKGSQCYSLVLTDERGERSYGYCRRVLPEGATVCLPLCYCLIGKYRAPGFYYKILQEIESHHGGSDTEIHSILQQLFDSDFPNPGEEVIVSYPNDSLSKCQKEMSCRSSQTMPDLRRSRTDSQSDSAVKSDSGDKNDCKVSKSDSKVSKSDSKVSKSDSKVSKTDSDNDNLSKPVWFSEISDVENNNACPKRATMAVEGTRYKRIKRPLEPRIDEHNLSTLLDSLGAGLLIKVFGSMLLERKVIVAGDMLGQLSSCMEALQSILYPFVWQQPLISSIPASIRRDILEAPLPILATLVSGDVSGIDEGMLVDLTLPSKVLFYQGDEATILPTSAYKTLKTTLQMETIKNKEKIDDTKTRNVLISEAFLRFFVDILGDFSKYFSVGDRKDGDMGRGDIIFDKETYVKNATPKQNQYFLEWFTETAMFNHFIQNMAEFHRLKSTTQLQSPDETIPLDLIDTPLPDFYELFHERMRGKGKGLNRNIEKTNYKSAVNKRIRVLKNKLRELVA